MGRGCGYQECRWFKFHKSLRRSQQSNRISSPSIPIAISGVATASSVTKCVDPEYLQLHERHQTLLIFPPSHHFFLFSIFTTPTSTYKKTVFSLCLSSSFPLKTHHNSRITHHVRQDLLRPQLRSKEVYEYCPETGGCLSALSGMFPLPRCWDRGDRG